MFLELPFINNASQLLEQPAGVRSGNWSILSSSLCMLGTGVEVLDAEWEVTDDAIAQPRLLLHEPRPTTKQLSSSIS